MLEVFHGRALGIFSFRNDKPYSVTVKTALPEVRQFAVSTA
jgi:hypothetical protein